MRVCMPSPSFPLSIPFLNINNITGEVTGLYADVTKKIIEKTKLNPTFVYEFPSYQDLGMLNFEAFHSFKDFMKSEPITYFK